MEKDYTSTGKYSPYTWEGCVVKIADKIAYIGRDIEDAKTLGFLDEEALSILSGYAKKYDQKAINSTIIMNNLISDICNNSSVEKGICMSEEEYRMLSELKQFNYKYIYKHKLLEPYKNYTELIINTIFNSLHEIYDGRHTFAAIKKTNINSELLINSFSEWLSGYVEYDIVPDIYKQKALKKRNKKIYSKLEKEQLYDQAIIDYISGMTDRFAIKVFNEIIYYG